METEIIVKLGVRRELMRVFGTTYPTVRLALSRYHSTKLHAKIRKAALELGGAEIKPYGAPTNTPKP